jgi:hypothetical protein
MIYQLPSGRTIEISLEQYLDMSDEDLDYLNAYYTGDAVEDPWFGSVLNKMPPVEDYYLPEEPVIEDLTLIPDEEKLSDPDLDIEISED